MIENGNNAPPYGTYSIFETFCENLKDTAIPDHIDRSMFLKLSGGDQTALLIGLRFLGLIDKDDKTTDSFRKLTEARKTGTDAWKSALREVITQRYEPIVGGINTETTTKAKIAECFRAAGVAPGQMTTKSIRFYLKAVEQFGGTISHYLKGMSGRMRSTTGGISRKKAVRSQPRTQAEQPSSSVKISKGDQAPEGVEVLPIPMLPGAHIQYPVGLTIAQCTMIEGAVTLLRTSVEISTKGDTK